MDIEKRSVVWTFVCQAGRLEAQSCVLAASLQRQMGADSDIELMALIPGPERMTGRVRDETLEFLKRLGVGVVPRDNEHLVQPRSLRVVDFMTNKICCLQVETAAQTIVFLDSDQICHASIDTSLFDVPFTAYRVGYAGARPLQGNWPRIYELCAARLPDVRIRVGGPGEAEQALFLPPLFNSGFVAVRKSEALELAATWRDCFQRLDQSDVSFGQNNYYLEQTALAVAVMKLGLTYHVADPELFDSSVLHYHAVERLQGRPRFLKMIREFIDEHPGLDRVLANDPQWVELLRSAPQPGRGTNRLIHDPVEVLENPELFPVRVTPDWKRFALVRLSSQEFDRHSFHDSRGLGELQSVGEVDIAALAAHLRRVAPQARRVDLIFHTAFCGSTLLARYLQLLGTSLYYREPEVFTQLAVEKWFAFRRSGSARWHEAFEVGMQLLSRRAEGRMIPGIKLHDSGTNLVDEFLARHSDSKAIVLYSDLPEFLLSNLKQGDRRKWVHTRLHACGGDSLVAVHFPNWGLGEMRMI